MSTCLLSGAMVLAATAKGWAQPLPGLEEEPPPQVADPQLKLEVFAQTPQLVTPVGLAVDARGRLFVIESHTHSPPQGYVGPNYDRIKILEDTNNDGRADKVTVFSDGLIEDMMNLAFAPDGRLFVIHRKGVTALADRDNDGKADGHADIIKVKTDQTYDHSGLLSGVIDQQGWLYLGRGNAAGFDYTYEGATGETLRSYGDGGHILRCRLDGSRLQRYATGFWNPFGMMFDAAGRLWAADNDPDSRGPNRLLQIVPGGDYGFRSRYGSSGLHPYVAWNGDLPGTLTYVAGVGESPGGLLDANTTTLPASYRDNVFVAVWAENSIEMFSPQPTPLGLVAKRRHLIKGGRNFRPVALAAGTDGSMFFTDWVKREYPNHGLGRVWRLSSKTDVPASQRIQPRPARTPYEPDAATAALNELLAQQASFDTLAKGWLAADPRLNAVATYRLSEPQFRERVLKALRAPQTRVRLGALQSLRWAAGAEYPFPKLGPAVLGPLLRDPDEAVRTVALMYAGESVDLTLAPLLPQALKAAKVGERLVQVYLATLGLLTPAEQQHLQQRKPKSTVTDALDRRAVWNALQTPKMSSDILAMVLPHLGVPQSDAELQWVVKQTRAPLERLQVEAIRTLGTSAATLAEDRLLQIAFAARNGRRARQEAVVALAAHPEALIKLLPLLQAGTSDTPDALRLTLARVLRVASGNAKVQEALAALPRARSGTPLASSVAFTLDPGAASEQPGRPQNAAQWLAATVRGGDAEQGRQLFFNPLLACSRCHSVGARGGAIGPNLSHVGSSMDRARLLDSIVNPSAEISPEFQSYAVVKKSGETLTGVQFHFRSPTSASMRLVDGSDVELRLSQVESYGAMESSLMPQGLEAAMTVDEMRDLLAFLQKLR